MATLAAVWSERRRVPPTAWFGIVVIALYVFVAVFAPLLAPYSQREVVDIQYAPWTAEHLLGTDNLGRDMVSRLIYAARNTLGIALATTALSFFLGGTAGLAWASTAFRS